MESSVCTAHSDLSVGVLLFGLQWGFEYILIVGVFQASERAQ